MKIQFLYPEYERLGTDRSFDAGLPADVVASYRKRLVFIDGTLNERDFHAIKSLRFKKILDENQMKYSIYLKDKWKLIIKLDNDNQTVIINSITNEEV